MSQPGVVHHKINYVEIPTRDMDATKSFYEKAFSWKFNDYGPDYAGISKKEGSGEMGGICRADNVSNGGLLVILYPEDLEASWAAVKNAGGRIAREIFSFPGGRRFHFYDPNGHELGVWSDGTEG